MHCKMEEIENLIYVERGMPDIVKKVVNTSPSTICCRFHRCVLFCKIDTNVTLTNKSNTRPDTDFTSLYLTEGRFTEIQITEDAPSA